MGRCTYRHVLSVLVNLQILMGAHMRAKRAKVKSKKYQNSGCWSCRVVTTSHGFHSTLYNISSILEADSLQSKAQSHSKAALLGSQVIFG